jgi:hypothetical protein
LQDALVMTVLKLFSGFSCSADLHLFCACCRVPQFRWYTAADYASRQENDIVLDLAHGSHGSSILFVEGIIVLLLNAQAMNGGWE